MRPASLIVTIGELGRAGLRKKKMENVDKQAPNSQIFLHGSVKVVRSAMDRKQQKFTTYAIKTS